MGDGVAGFGLGLRTPHYDEILSALPAVEWFEALSENYMVGGGKPLYYLDRIAEIYPIVLHGVSMSLGSVDPLNQDYLLRLKQLAQRVNAPWVSDHLCWTGVSGRNSHDLLPLPYTEEALNHIVGRVQQAQDVLGRHLLIENVSSYVSFVESEISEWEFLAALAERADCYLLLDVNNVYVSSYNHGFSAVEFIDGIPMERVKQVHIAGHTNQGDHIIDTHDHPVIDEVWGLYDYFCRKCGAVPTMIERDDNIPPLAELVAELDIARRVAACALGQESAA